MQSCFQACPEVCIYSIVCFNTFNSIHSGAAGGGLDPHFMVTNEVNGEHFCWDYNGEDKEVLKLVQDPVSGKN